MSSGSHWLGQDRGTDSRRKNSIEMLGASGLLYWSIGDYAVLAAAGE
jgi:hypothetical protein